MLLAEAFAHSISRFDPLVPVGFTDLESLLSEIPGISFDLIGASQSHCEQHCLNFPYYAMDGGSRRCICVESSFTDSHLCHMSSSDNTESSSLVPVYAVHKPVLCWKVEHNQHEFVTLIPSASSCSVVLNS